MPGLDQTGPMGKGPMTGWKMGRCTNFGAGNKNQAGTSGDSSEDTMTGEFQGRGFGRGRGGRGRFGSGRGFRNRFRGGF